MDNFQWDSNLHGMDRKYLLVNKFSSEANEENVT